MTTAGGPDGCRALVLQVVVTMPDGTVVRHGSNTRDWVVRQGPILWDHLFHGETYDARLELDGWAAAPLATWAAGAPRTAAGWEPAVVMHPPPGAERNITSALGPLSPAMTPPIRITESFPALVLTKLSGSGGGGGSGTAANCAPSKLAAMADECRGFGPTPPARCEGADPVYAS